MQLFNASEVTENYSNAGVKKTALSVGNALLLGILAGLLIAFGAAVTNTGAHALENVSIARIVSGLLFPFGLAMVILTGAELFTGNCLITITVLDRKVRLTAMLRNLVLVYIGNFIGAILLAAGCAFFGQMNYSGGGLAVYTIKVAISKCSLSFSSALVLGFFCNILVCIGVLCSLSAKDVPGRIMGAYLPVAFFVICGFEHSIANMYYIPAGLFAMQVPEYAKLAAEAGLNTGALTWGSFLVNNLLPVTIGNIIGGVCVAVLMWRTNSNKAKPAAENKHINV